MKRLRAKSRKDMTSMERTSITRSYEIIVAQVAGDSASTGPVTGAARSLDRVLLEAVFVCCGLHQDPSPHPSDAQVSEWG